MTHSFISTIYTLNRKSKNWINFPICFTFDFIFQMAPIFFTFFLLFNTIFLLFVLLFQIPKKNRSTIFFLRVLVSHMGNDGALVVDTSQIEKTKKNRCFGVSACQKKSLRAILPRCRCCVYFVYPEGQNQTSSAGVHSVSRAENIMRICEKSPI